MMLQLNSSTSDIPWSLLLTSPFPWFSTSTLGSFLVRSRSWKPLYLSWLCTLDVSDCTKNLGAYTIQLNAVLNESGNTSFAGKELPSHKINFTVNGEMAVGLTSSYERMLRREKIGWCWRGNEKKRICIFLLIHVICFAIFIFQQI